MSNKTNHIGKFMYPQDLIEETFDVLFDLLSTVLIVEATAVAMKSPYPGYMILYTGISPMWFRSVEDGANIPMYDVLKDVDGGLCLKEHTPSMIKPADNLIMQNEIRKTFKN